ncbi:unnamed protein product [Prorocentrum cordatum]|uniref:Major facilitator superfamily (MFS) profile domain-containing protein n=1 Tax=Prorocentrum cordatum TaxID=2364126 RepID=A0ABN9W6Q0_9DINO|nr:unnamed protein product [Polarella glacialis]
MAIPIFPLLEKADVLIGVLFAAKAAFQILSSPLAARLVDRRPREMIALGLALEAGTVLLFATAFSYPVWLAARALSGVTSSLIISAGFAHLNGRFSDGDQRAVAMGLATTGIVGGVCLGPVLGGTLYQARPALPFALLAAAELAVALLAWRCLPGLEGAPAAAGGEAGLGTMARSPEVLRPLGALAAANAAISCLESTVARHLREAFGLSAGQVGAAFLLVSGPSCLLSGAAGPLGNRLGRARLVRAGLLLQGLSTMLGPKSWLWVNLVSFVGIGAGMGAIDGATPSLLGEVASERFGGSGKIFVLSNVAVQLGFVVGPILGNSIVGVYGFGVCSVAAGAALVVYAPIIRRMSPSSKSSHQTKNAILESACH